MSDYSELERRAQAAIDAIGTLSRARQEREFNDVCTPQVVKALIAENDLQHKDLQNLRTDNAQLIYALKQEQKSYLVLRDERDQLRAENERLNAENKQLILLECNGGTAQAAVNLLTERDQLKAELEKAQLIGRLAYNFDGYKAVLDERDQLRAEVAGLKTGYEAYERVNAELKAECEGLRKDADRFRRMRAMTLAQIEDTQDEFDAGFDRQLDAAMGKGERS